jgi:hypothetical protein
MKQEYQMRIGARYMSRDEYQAATESLDKNSVTWMGSLISLLTLANSLTFTLAGAYQLQWVFVHVPYYH